MIIRGRGLKRAYTNNNTIYIFSLLYIYYVYVTGDLLNTGFYKMPRQTEELLKK